MPDITMCKGSDIDNGECPNKERCYRYTASPNTLRQLYFNGLPMENGKCDFLWTDEKEGE